MYRERSAPIRVTKLDTAVAGSVCRTGDHAPAVSFHLTTFVPKPTYSSFSKVSMNDMLPAVSPGIVGTGTVR